MAWIPADGKYQRVLIDSVYYTTWSGKSRDPFPLDTVSAFNKNFKIDDKWYDLQGRQLNGKPSGKGIYINNGRKQKMAGIAY